MPVIGAFSSKTISPPHLPSTSSQIGSEVSRFQKGDKELGIDDPMTADATSTQQYVILHERLAAPVLQALSENEVATRMLNLMTAVFALFRPIVALWLPLSFLHPAQDFNFVS